MWFFMPQLKHQGTEDTWYVLKFPNNVVYCICVVIIILKHEIDLCFVVELCFRNFTSGTLMEPRLALNPNDSV